ncbi:hypothetical protein CDD81_5076 [Ophiocordyceps australis]|uniref:Pre-mRNA-splicing factor CWC24 n=1 Tax=Ophiocordyceps australis TaxID=1399860 RepID=A0A2C5Y8Y5_9HYPO|nr:hypothetical protein CDD81_5076 [Ophiocordyceps australis]
MTATVHTANRDTPITTTNDATKQSNWYEQDDQVSTAAGYLLGSTRQVAKNTQPHGTYKGLASAKPKTTVGPIQAPTNVRTITVTDFAPDVCKDYKQTGFCGFGDNCKFLHSREDYKQGWQLDREWENVSKGRHKMGGTVVASARRDKPKDDDDDDEEAMLDNIPFVCIICRESYKEPIVTRCGHYFCEACALKRYRRDPTCAACGVGTNGVFNTAKRLKRLLTRKRERAAIRRKEAIEAGEEVSDGDEETHDK